MRTRRLSWRFVVLAATAIAAISSVPGHAHGQTFSQSFLEPLNRQCSGFRGDSAFAPPSGGLGTYGSNLAAICTGIPNAASGGGSAITVDMRGTAELEQQRILNRLRERRAQEQAASADGGGARGLSLYGAAEYQYAEKDVTFFEPGYERDTYGATIGADYLFGGGKVLAGLAFNYARQSGSYFARGGNFEVDSFGPTLYVSVFPIDQVFVDAYAGYTRHEYDLVRRFSFAMNSATQIPSGRTEGDTSGNEFKLGVNGGYDFRFGRFTIGPRLGLDYRENHIDGYTESGASGVAQGLELVYDDVHEQSLTSKVGLFASMAHGTGWGVLVPQATIEWRHEFLNDQRAMYFSFKEDLLGQRFRYQNDRPDRDYFNASLGLVAILPNGLAPFVNVRQFFGYKAQWSTTATAGLRVSF